MTVRAAVDERHHRRALAHPARAADPVTIQLKWVTQAQFAGYYVAKAMNYYKDADLDVTIKPGGPDIAPPQVIAGACPPNSWISMHGRENLTTHRLRKPANARATRDALRDAPNTPPTALAPAAESAPRLLQAVLLLKRGFRNEQY